MKSYERFSITLTAYDPDDEHEASSMVVAADTSTGTTRVSGLHYNGYDPDVDVRRLWDRVDLDALTAMLPKASTVYDGAEHFTPEAVDQAVALAEQLTSDQPAIEPPYFWNAERIASRLRQRIQDGELAPETAFPTRDRLGEWFPGASTWAIKEAMTALRSEGLITADRGRGTHVNDPRKPAAPLEPTKGAPVPGRRFGQVATRGKPTPPADELFDALKRRGSIRGVAEFYRVEYHTAHGWIKRAERNERLAQLPIVDPET